MTAPLALRFPRTWTSSPHAVEPCGLLTAGELQREPGRTATAADDVRHTGAADGRVRVGTDARRRGGVDRTGERGDVLERHVDALGVRERVLEVRTSVREQRLELGGKRGVRTVVLHAEVLRGELERVHVRLRAAFLRA